MLNLNALICMSDSWLAALCGVTTFIVSNVTRVFQFCCNFVMYEKNPQILQLADR